MAEKLAASGGAARLLELLATLPRVRGFLGTAITQARAMRQLNQHDLVQVTGHSHVLI